MILINSFEKIYLFLLRYFNHNFAKSYLSVTQRQDIITCILKGDKPLAFFFKNWRPIFLLNNAYKLLSYVFAERFKNILPSSVSINQTGFISNRYIRDNVRLIYNLVNCIKSNDITGMSVVIDLGEGL